MTINLLDLLKSQLGSSAINYLSSFLGESEGRTQSAVNSTLATLLSGFLSNGGTTSGAANLLSLFNSKQQSSTSAGELVSMLGSGESSVGSLIQLGKPILDTLFGSKLGGIVDLLGSSSGMQKNSASSLLSILAPIVTSVLGKQVRDGGLNAAGLMGLLMGQKDHIKAAAPAGLAGALGVSSLDNLFNPGALAANYATANSSSDGGGGIGKWLLPLLLLGLLGAGGFYFLKGCGKEAGDVASTTVENVGDAANAAGQAVAGAADSLASAAGDAANAAGQAAGNAADAAGQAVSDTYTATVETLGKLFKRKLADGVELNIPENGVENRLVTFIEDKTKLVDKKTWFSFDRLYFETGKSTLKQESQEQLKNIVAIMKAYPNVEIKLGGYTDNTGDPKKNMELSQKRAETTMQELIKLGVAAKRLKAEGYGDQHPVADNATPEGRAKNRRIDINVTKK